MLLSALLSIAVVFSLIFPASAAVASATVHRPDDRSINHLAVDSSSAAPAMALNTPEGEVTPVVAAGYAHVVGLRSDGTVVAVGDNFFGQCNIGGWTDIVQVAAGAVHTVGVKADDTVVAVGTDSFGQLNVGSWTDITQVVAGDHNTVGLMSNGTVVALGYNYYGQCDVGGWKNIIQVAVSLYHTVGLKKDGTVVAVGDNSYGQCDVDGWTDISQVAAGYYHTVGLKTDGTVVAVGANWARQCETNGWTDITEVAAGGGHTVGLKKDGTVVAVGAETELPTWNLVVIEYTLNISSTAGGSVTEPGKGTSTYDAGTVVDLVAEPEEGYRFVNWTGDVGTIADVKDAETTITMLGDYSITANFEAISRCFIATAAYGTPMAEEIEILREFRDEYLLTNPLGQALVGLYYRASPPIAEFITEHLTLKPIVRAGLLPAVAMATVSVNTTPAEKTAIVGLLVLVSVVVAALATRRQGRGPEYT